MPIIVIDTFTAYATADFAARGWTNTGAMFVGSGTGQSGLNSVRHTANNQGSTLEYPIVAATDVTVGFCFKSQWLDITSNPSPIFEFISGGGEVTALAVGTDGAFTVWDVSGTDTLRASSVPNLFREGVEHYLEFRVKCSTTVGEVYVWLNGAPTPIISATGIDTGSASVNKLALYKPGGIGNNPYGDTDHSMFYALDNGSPASHLGHIRGAVLRPTGNGNQSDFIGSDGNQVDNYLLVDDTAPDGDTTYVYSSTPNDVDTYPMGNMPSTPQAIYAVQSVLWAKKQDAGSRSLAPVLRSGGVDYPGVDQALSTSYLGLVEIFDEDPDTSAAWTEAGVNALEYGPKVAS